MFKCGSKTDDCLDNKEGCIWCSLTKESNVKKKSGNHVSLPIFYESVRALWLTQETKITEPALPLRRKSEPLLRKMGGKYKHFP